MKKLLILLLSIFLLSSCGELPSLKKYDLVGEATSEFSKLNFKKSEDTNNVAIYEKKTIDAFNEMEYMIIDMYKLSDDIIAVAEDKEGNITYLKISGSDFKVEEINEGSAIDQFIMSQLTAEDDFWGFMKLKNYTLIIKSTGSDLYRDNEKIKGFDGSARIDDIDNDGDVEVFVKNVEGNILTLYKINENSLSKLWELSSDKVRYDGNLQIADLNGDGINEFYTGDTPQDMRKFIFVKGGVSKDSNLLQDNDISKTGICHFLDCNGDGKKDIIVVEENKKPVVYIQK